MIMTICNHLKKKIFLLVMIIIYPYISLYSANDLTINREFSVFTSKNLEGYLKPLFTTVSESLNSNLFTTALYDTTWTIGLDISVMGMLIPNSQKTFTAIRPDKFGDTNVCRTAEIRNGELLRDYLGANIQPTIYGGASTAIFSQPVNMWAPDSFYKSVAYVEGNNISFMMGIPNLQLIFGFPTGTQLRTKFFFAPIQNETLLYYSIILNQRFDQFFNIFDPKYKMGLAFNFSFHRLFRDRGIDIRSWACGVHFSKEWFEGLSTYFALQYEDMTGKFIAIKDTTGAYNSIVDSPYEEVRKNDPLEFDIGTFSNFRVLAGASFKYSIFELHADAAWLSQPAFNIGITFWFAEIGKATDKPPIIEEPIKPKEEEKREKLD
jgi:hypothetical protein